ncbi:ATPase [Porphyrobacter sp. SLTP]|uniref:P-loop ATPase, Sll1717 family n=1 Tax=Porphyrobacter sp. SLTP TaxID=2683266 RepID=UPI0014129293|nr:ATPase [Porphyrobacter sp. SLTP]NBB25017.1 ATPase [Porphyrobacter sp. SLTP]
MTMMIDWIDFGQVSAERDENLSSYFFENGVLQAVVDNRYRFLVLGRKGAGKTAVFQHFNENYGRYLNEGDIAVNLSLQNYSWDVHSLLSAEGKASSLAYIQSWKYIIYLLCVKEIAGKVKSKKIRDAVKIIERIYSSPVPSLGQVIGQKLLQLSKLKLPSGAFDFEGLNFDGLSADGGEISFTEVQKDDGLQVQLNRSIERLTDIFEDALTECVENGPRIVISFDRIDEAWDTASFEASQRIIAGLVGASEFINSKFRGKLRPIVFLREDIFETIDLNDKNKLRSDCGQLLAWSKEGLSRMILERVNFYAKNAGQSELLKIEELFDKDQMRQQRAPFDHIMLRTMVRPRDFIRFFQLVREDMLQRRDNPFDEEDVNADRLECQAIYNVEPAYSEWLVEELKDEWRTQFPMINSLLATIQSMGKTNFDRVDFERALKANGASCTSNDVTSYLRFLFDNSIIGFRVGKSNQWRYKCFFSSQGFVESELYKVHDGLHRGLNLTESRAAS